MKSLISGFSVQQNTSLALFSEEQAAPLWAENIESPSFIVCSGEWLFAVTENQSYAVIYAYRKEGDGYRLTDRRNVEGALLCHIAYSARNRMLIGSCYETGNVIYTGFDPETGLFDEVHSIFQKKEGVISRQHCSVLNKAEDKVFTMNLGLDRVYVYGIANGELTEEKVLDVKAGSGPRHARLSADEKLLYVITEYSNEIFVYDTESWELKQSISTLPPEHFGKSNCSTLCISPDNRFLYAANRFADTIAQFAIGEDGLLTMLAQFECGGRNPRHMELTPDGSTLVICCQDSDWVVYKRLSGENGLPVQTVREVPFWTPSCVVFLP